VIKQTTCIGNAGSGLWSDRGNSKKPRLTAGQLAVAKVSAEVISAGVEVWAPYQRSECLDCFSRRFADRQSSARILSMPGRPFGFRSWSNHRRSFRLRSRLRLRECRRRHGEDDRGYKQTFHFGSFECCCSMTRRVPRVFPAISHPAQDIGGCPAFCRDLRLAAVVREPRPAPARLDVSPATPSPVTPTARLSCHGASHRPPADPRARPQPHPLHHPASGTPRPRPQPCAAWPGDSSAEKIKGA
jgi:hypothetical protein